MPDLGAVVAVAVIVLALAWIALWAHPLTRPVARLIALPVLAIGAVAAVLLSVLHLTRPRPRREESAPRPPALDPPGGATGYVERVEADAADAAERAATRELREAAEATGDVTPLIERERELRARLGLPPLD